MKTNVYIESKIGRLPHGFIFTYKYFISDVNQTEAIIKALNRLAESGKIAKLSKGKFYKPKDTIFGVLQPNEYQVVKDLLGSNGKTIGYLSGFSIFNSLGLTTQVSNVIQIARNETRPKFKRGFYTISFIKQKNLISKENITLLQILDALRFIKIIPDSSPAISCKRFIAIIKALSETEKSVMVRLALKYQPCTRALLGALLEKIGFIALTEPLRKSLNPITVYKLRGISKALSTAKKWNIQ